jgi:hypothetical protein
LLAGELLINSLTSKFAFIVFFLSPLAWGIPYIDHANLQVAGEVGVLSAGLGKDLTPRYSLGVMYGIVPKEFSKTEMIETVTLRQTYRFYDWDRMEFYGGLNIYHVLGLRYETSKYREAPNGYYSVNAIRVLLNLGTSIAINHKRDTRFYFEGGINDLWLVNLASNSETVGPWDHVSLALGWKTSF